MARAVCRVWEGAAKNLVRLVEALAVKEEAVQAEPEAADQEARAVEAVEAEE